jgi:hypothetical protein
MDGQNDYRLRYFSIFLFVSWNFFTLRRVTAEKPIVQAYKQFESKH